MPNYYRDKYNNFIDNAAEIYQYLTATYMEIYENRLLDPGTSGIEIGKMQFLRVCSYRRTKSVQSDFENINNAMRANLRYCAGLEAAFGYFVISDHKEIYVYIAIEETSTDRFVNNMQASIPDVSFNSGFIPFQSLSRLSAYGGVLNGNVNCENIVVDKILSILLDINGVFALLAVPMSQSEVQSYTAALSDLKQIAEDLMDNHSPQNQRVNRRSYGYVPEINDYLENAIEYYGNTGEEFWKYCMYFGCEFQHDVNQLGNSIRSALNGNMSEKSDKIRCYHTVELPIKSGRLIIPGADYSQLNYHFSDALRKPSLLSYISTSDISTLIQLPTESYPGFEAIQLEKDKDSLSLFGTNYKQTSEESILLGTDISSNRQYFLELKDLTEHLLITGSTGAGKTNTVMDIARGVHNARIPLLIIEPAKKDYWHLSSGMRDMRIFSFGRDGTLLGINPMMPEDGTIIANHVDSLLHAFSGAFEMEPATRFALDGLMKYTYEHFGWRLSDLAFQGEKPFPKIQDMIAFLPEYVNHHLPYGDEVRNNIYGSLINRLSSLSSGLIGESANADKMVTGKELCTGTVLIELDDLSIETKPFMAMLIMIKVEQYLRQKNASSSLSNVIVLEEAHNIFANVTGNVVSNTKQMASDSFSNMLSQIREYGTGIIIADQGASQINDTAVSNTKIKIIHAIVDGADIDKIVFALNLSEAQKHVFPSLKTGEAIVSVRGTRAVSKVRINKINMDTIRNVACVFCPKRRYCGNFNKTDIFRISRQSVYAQEIYQNRFNADQLKATIQTLASRFGSDHKTLCLLGQLLSDGCLQIGDREKRRIVCGYME